MESQEYQVASSLSRELLQNYDIHIVREDLRYIVNKFLKEPIG